jgi:hypothetical protein
VRPRRAGDISWIDDQEGAGIRGVPGKANSFYDDVMQTVFSFFFSFLFLPSL